MGDESRGRVVIISGSVGAGHDGVAYELADRLRDAGHPVEVRDMLEGFPLFVRVLLGSAYILILRIAPWLYALTFWAVERSRLMQWTARRLCVTASSWLLDAVVGADVVVATYPPASQALGVLRANGDLTIPVVTYLTDPAPNFLWLHPGVDLHLTASRETAIEAEAGYGLPVEVGGPLVSPVFRQLKRAEAREAVGPALGIDREARIALVLLGSLGVGDVRAAVRALGSAGFLPVVLCGRNTRLSRRLVRFGGCLPLGWRDDVPTLLASADVVVHNAGGLSLTESLVAGVPAVTFAAIAGHGRANARSLQQGGLAPWARNAGQLTTYARAALTGDRPRWPVEDETACQRISELVEAQRTATVSR